MMRSRVGLGDRGMARQCILTSEYTQRDTAPIIAADARNAGDCTMSDSVLIEIEDEIALITLNRPQRLNALDYELIDRLMAALDRVEVEARVRAIILTGAGERAFSAGADIHEFSGSVN